MNLKEATVKLADSFAKSVPTMTWRVILLLFAVVQVTVSAWFGATVMTREDFRIYVAQQDRKNVEYEINYEKTSSFLTALNDEDRRNALLVAELKSEIKSLQVSNGQFAAQLARLEAIAVETSRGVERLNNRLDK